MWRGFITILNGCHPNYHFDFKRYAFHRPSCFLAALLEQDGSPEGHGAAANAIMSRAFLGDILARIVVELDLITPPVGKKVFLVSAAARNADVRDLQGRPAFFGAEISRLLVVLAFLGLVLWPPQVFGS